MNIFSRLMALSVIVIFALSCSRAKSNNSTIVFELPASPQQQKADFSLLSVPGPEWMENIELDDHWSSVTPTGFDGVGTAPINCYAVMVGGSEAEFNTSYCGRKTASNTITKMFSFGPWAGAVPALASGTQIQMEILAGSGRNFYLVGFHAANASACVDFRKASPNQSDLTRPLIVGEVTGVKLEPGATQTIAIKRSVDSDRWFDDCEFNENLPENNNDKVATGIVAEFIRKEFIPDSVVFPSQAPTYLVSGIPTNVSCMPLRIRLIDNKYSPARLPTAISGEIKACEGVSANCYTAANPLVPIPFHDTYASCATSNDGDGNASFTIGGNSDSVVKWVRGPVGLGTVNPNHHIFLQASAPNMASLAPKKYAVRSTSDTFTNINGPKNIRAGVCEQYNAFSLSYDNNTMSTDLWDQLELEKYEASSNSWADVSGIYSNSGCSTAFAFPSPAIFAVNHGFYVKAGAGYYRIKVGTSAVNSDDGVFYFQIHDGGTSPVTVKYQGHPLVADNQTCSGPHKLVLLNERGSQVTATSPVSLSLQTFGGGIQLFSGGCSTALSTANFAIGESEKHFYIRTTSNVGHNSIQINGSASDGTVFRSQHIGIQVYND